MKTDKEIMENIASGLRQARAAKRVSQSDAAAACGVSQATWSNWENAETAPQADVLWKIADFFNVSLDRLMNRDT